jgi:RNA polymerase sigma-70 factor (ECF subfamily)
LTENNIPDQSSVIEELVARAIKGDGDAFGRLYDLHVDRIYRHICYRVDSNADAEDLTQQVFIKAWQAIGRYRKTASPFPAWLIRISQNLVIDYYRSRKSDVYDDFDNTAAKSDTNPEHMVENEFNREYIRKVINQLKGNQQQVILMRFIEDFSYPEIAAAMGKSEGSIRVIQHRGLVKLREILTKVKQ